MGVGIAKRVAARALALTGSGERSQDKLGHGTLQAKLEPLLQHWHCLQYHGKNWLYSLQALQHARETAVLQGGPAMADRLHCQASQS